MSNQSEAIFTAIIADAGTEDATIILPGSSTATRKRYKYALTGQQLSAGDRVYVIPISGTYVLLGGAVAGGGDWVTQEELEEALEPHDQVITPYTVGPSSVAAFDASVGGVPLNDLTVSIEPVQAGSGDPSPTNVRPITGWTGCNIHVSPTTTGGTVYPVSWQSEAGTVYGGTLDVTTDVLTVDRYGYTFTGNESFAANSAWGPYTFLYNTGVQLISSYSIQNYCKSSHFTVINGGSWADLVPNTFLIAGSTYIGLGFDGTKEALKSWLTSQATNGTPVQIMGVLANPVTYQLTPTEVTTLLGQNNIWADCGPVTVTYGDYVKTVYDRIQQGGGLPAGGAAGDALVKQSAAAGDAIWSPLLYRGEDGGLCEVDEI